MASGHSWPLLPPMSLQNPEPSSPSVASSTTSGIGIEAGHAEAAEGSSTDLLFPLVYRELHALAAAQMTRERGDHTLQPTALVHEVYVRLSAKGERHWRDRQHFLAVASRAIRRVLVNHAHAHRAQRRGGGAQRVTLHEGLLPFGDGSVDLCALDEALAKLEAVDERQGRMVELRFFGGLSIDGIAELIGVSPRTVDDEWAMARGFLRECLGRAGS